MASRSRLCPLVTAVVGTIIMATLLIHINLSSSNHVVAHLGRKFSLSSQDASTTKSEEQVDVGPTENRELQSNDGEAAPAPAPEPAKVEIEKCDDIICKKYLTPREWPYYDECVNETQHPRLNKRSEGPLVEEVPTPCTFFNGTARKTATLLISFPGSGNTWFRGLLQQATGVCTGSHKCDGDLRRHGFPGEGVIGKGSGTFLPVYELDIRHTIEFDRRLVIELNHASFLAVLFSFQIEFKSHVKRVVHQRSLISFGRNGKKLMS